MHLEGKPVDKFGFGKLAKKSKGLSGADLKGAVDLAVEEKLREALKKGTPTPITERDVAQALGRVRPTTKEWLATAKNHALYANEGGVYDDIRDYLGL